MSNIDQYMYMYIIVYALTNRKSARVISRNHTEHVTKATCSSSNRKKFLSLISCLLEFLSKRYIEISSLLLSINDGCLHKIIECGFPFELLI